MAGGDPRARRTRAAPDAVPSPGVPGPAAHDPTGRLPSSLPTPGLQRAFARFRDDAARFREDLLAAEEAALGASAESQALENVRIVRSVFGKWAIEILALLVTQPSVRFSDLRRRLGSISSDVLSRKLFALETIGLVERAVGTGRPPTVEYCLTEDGLTLTRLGEPILLFLRLRERRAPEKGTPTGRHRRTFDRNDPSAR